MGLDTGGQLGGTRVREASVGTVEAEASATRFA